MVTLSVRILHALLLVAFMLYGCNSDRTVFENDSPTRSVVSLNDCSGSFRYAGEAYFINLELLKTVRPCDYFCATFVTDSSIFSRPFHVAPAQVQTITEGTVFLSKRNEASDSLKEAFDRCISCTSKKTDFFNGITVASKILHRQNSDIRILAAFCDCNENVSPRLVADLTGIHVIVFFAYQQDGDLSKYPEFASRIKQLFLDHNAAGVVVLSPAEATVFNVTEYINNPGGNHE